MVKDPYSKVVTPETQLERSCPQCGHVTTGFSTACPQCGYTMSKRSQIMYWVIATLLIAVGILAYYIFYMT